MYEKEIRLIAQAVEENLELEYYNTNRITNNFKILSIDGEKISEDLVILVSMDDRRPVDSEATGSDVAYNWKDWFARLEFRKCMEEPGLFGKKKLKMIQYHKVIITKEMWKLKKKTSVVNTLHLQQELRGEDTESEFRKGRSL